MSYLGRRLEQGCVRPGWWRIEGYDCHLFDRGGAWGHRRWNVSRFGSVVHSARTLDECREWIAGQCDE